MQRRNCIRKAHIFARDAHEAGREFHASVAQPDTAFVVFFCSSDYDLGILGAAIQSLFEGVQVVGCTTAGEIGPSGYREHSIVGASFSSRAFIPVIGHIESLNNFEISAGQALGQQLLRELEEKDPNASHQNSFAFMLIDGLSAREEPVARAFQNGLGKIPVIGGSAADGVHFNKTHVYVDGRFRSDCAALILASTPLSFKAFKTQHFVSTDQRLVITEADTAHRIVKEINGLPAAQEYARLLGVEVDALNAKRFAVSPVVVLIDGQNYVRSIQKANLDGSITFYCAIEEGVVLRVARGTDLVENLEQVFNDVRAEIGPPQLVLGWDCILRKLEVVHNHLEARVGEIYRTNNTIGFNTYGEQFRGIHVNQTLSGIAIGESSVEV